MDNCYNGLHFVSDKTEGQLKVKGETTAADLSYNYISGICANPHCDDATNVMIMWMFVLYQ